MILSKLKETMKEKKLSTEELAVKTCMSSSTIFKARSGTHVTVNTAKRIASGLRVDLEKLI